MSSIIDATNLQKRYRVADKDPGFVGTLRHFVRRRTRDVEAVKGATFQVERGEVVGFLGPNGAGKTTTLKMLTGLIHPSAGELQVCGHVPFERKKDFLRSITLVMGQKQQLIWDLPAIDSLRINAALYEIDDKERDRRVGELSEMLEIGPLLTKPVRKLSLGERMKAELLAALLHQPAVLFLDEPTLGLDVNAQVTIRRFLAEYNAHHDATILLTSHYMGDITALCQRVVLINQGHLVFDGDLGALLEKWAPHRAVQVELRAPCARSELEAIAPVEDIDGCAVRFAVAREELTATIHRLLERLDVKDLTVTEPPVEEIIGQVFRAPREGVGESVRS